MHRTDLAINECALYKVQSLRHLAEVLLIDRSDLKALARRGRGNYHEYAQAMGGDKPPRWVECPNESLKRVQRRIRRLLAQILPPDFLFSGVKGRSAITNAIRHQARHERPAPVGKLDIAKFYPSSDGRRVYWFFFRTMQCSAEVSSLLCDLTTIPPTSTSNHVHLPTGGATSQDLAYYGYQEMFAALAKLAADNNVSFGVFVDDIAFSGEGATRRLLNEARVIIQRFDLRSKRAKEESWRANDTKLITGVVLTQGGARLPNIRRLTIHQLQQSFHHARLLEDRVTLARRLLGALFSAGQIEERYTKQGRTLLRKLKADLTLWEAMRQKPKADNSFTQAQFRQLTESLYNTGAARPARTA